MRLEGKVALITGGGSGIGKSTAILFSREGARVIVSDIDEVEAMNTVESIKALNLHAELIVGENKAPLINLASIIGLVGYPAHSGSGFNPYAPSKGAVLQFTRNLAVECASKGIRINCICPGYIYTNMTKSLTDDPVSLDELENRHPMGRLGNPEDIASAALFLASDESSFMTGAPLVVDGGYTAQ